MNIWAISLPLFVLILVFLFFSSYSFAHPGQTASDGCHYCRTNCDNWGVGWNVRHCHDTKITPKTANVVTPIKEESNFISDHPFASLALAGSGGYSIYKLVKRS